MVATRRTMRSDPHDEGDGAAPAGEPNIDASEAKVQTQRRMKCNSQLPEAENEPKSGEATIRDADTQSQKPGVSIATRSRSGQSEGEISEADSNCSGHSTRLTRSRQPLAYLTESARKLRNRTVVLTEPILESKEGSELSEAESNCSSVSTEAKRRQAVRITRSKSTRSRRCPLISYKEDTEVSETESNCSSVSGVENRRRTRSTRSRRNIPTPVTEPQNKEVSDAESCTSGISAKPIARRLSRRIQSKSAPDSDENDNKTSKDGSQELEIRRTRRTSGVTVSEPKCTDKSPATEPKTLSPPRMSLRNRVIYGSEDAMEVPATESQYLENTKENAIIESVVKEDTSEAQEMSMEKEEVLVPQPSTNLEISSKTDDDPEPMVIGEQTTNSTDLPEKSMDVEQSPVESSSKSPIPTYTIILDSDSEESKDVGDHLETVTPPGSSVPSDGKSEITPNKPDLANISLLTDSDESEDSENNDEDNDEVAQIQEKEEEDRSEHLGESRNQKVISQEPSEDLPEDGLFVIDTAPGVDSTKKYYIDHKKDDPIAEEEEPSQPVDEEDDFIDEDEDAELLNKPKPGFVLSTSIDTGINIKDMGGLYISFDAKKPNPGPNLLKKMKQERRKKDELLQKSVITPDFEKKESVPPYKESANKKKKQRKEEREKTTGRGWFDMKAPEMTEELKNDLKALKMRSAMDPKRFYKKNDRDGFPKYFQVATVVDSPVDFFHSRIPKKERKRTIVDELLADAEFRRYNKKKYQEIMTEKAAIAEGKKKRKKKKFKK